MGGVDVVMATRDRAWILPRAVRSVLAQTSDDWTLTVVADGCTDDTLTVMDEFTADDRVRVVESDGVGPAGARNRGVAEGSAPLLAFLDDDNVWRPTFLEVMRAEIGDAVLAYSGQQTYVVGGSPDDMRIIGRRIRSVPFNPVTLLQQNFIDTSCVLLRRETFEQVGGFDAELVPGGEDWDLYGRIALTHPFRVRHVDEVLGEHWGYLPEVMPTLTNQLDLRGSGAPSGRAAWLVEVPRKLRAVALGEG